MATIELNVPVGVDWQGQHGLNHEWAVIRRLAEQAGWEAYNRPGWSNTAIHQEAQTFLSQSLLLAPLHENLIVLGLVHGRFLKGWRAHEAHERRQP